MLFEKMEEPVYMYTTRRLYINNKGAGRHTEAGIFLYH